MITEQINGTNGHVNAGFTVLGPDYFFGDPIQNHMNEEGWDRPAWMAKSRKAAGELVPKWFEAVKEKYG
jgi:hypothetical protein